MSNYLHEEDLEAYHESFFFSLVRGEMRAATASIMRARAAARDRRARAATSRCRARARAPRSTTGRRSAASSSTRTRSSPTGDSDDPWPPGSPWTRRRLSNFCRHLSIGGAA